jgi:hypothetical protein
MRLGSFRTSFSTVTLAAYWNDPVTGLAVPLLRNQSGIEGALSP